MTNYLLQVNFWATAGSLEVQRFKLALWKVGGIKIKSAAGRLLVGNHIVCHRYRQEKVQNTLFSTLEPL